TNGSAQVTAGGGTSPYQYAWSPSGGTATTASGLASGSYMVTVTDAHNCIQSASAIVTQPSSLTASIPVSSPVICYGGNNGTAHVSAGGGTAPYQYAWSPSGGTSTIASGLTAGNYTVTVTDVNNCSRTANVTITQPPLLTAGIPAPVNVSCYGGNNGSASVTVNGGTSPYQYAWSPSGGTAAGATGLAAGNYTVAVSDANGCSLQRNAVILQPDSMTLGTTSIPALCNGQSTGSATVTVVGGGTGPFTYNWAP